MSREDREKRKIPQKQKKTPGSRMVSPAGSAVSAGEDGAGEGARDVRPLWRGIA